MNARRIIYSLCSLLLCFISTSTFSQNSASCEHLNTFSNGNSSLVITSSSWAVDKSAQANPFAPAMSLPVHCHVEGYLDKRIGADGNEYSIGFALNLPENWNGRFLFQGGGGLNGSIGEPIGMQASGSQTALDRGFAVVSTDSGHTGGGFDAAFMADQEAALNFFYLANTRVTEVTRQLVTEFYDRSIDTSYFVGCSTGGREGMIMSQRYPFYFDGIISGAPAIRTGLSNLAIRWVSIKLNQAAAKDDQGLPVPGGTFNKTEQSLIVDAFLNSCDSRDGAEDGLVFDTNCGFDPMTLACKTNSNENCISEVKALALNTAFGGPIDSRGIQVYPGFLFDTGIDDVDFIPGLIAGNNNPPVGPSVNTVLVQDIDAEFVAATAIDAAIGDSTSLNLSSFAGNGGKLIFYHGVSDPWFSALDTVGYYERMSARNGGLEVVDKWSRLFLVPGMGHCQGGETTLDSFDMLSSLVEWVENDIAPEQVIATGQSMPGVSRPLCPYPSFPQYSGIGDINEAANYQCSE